MRLRELEDLLELRRETQTFEVKESMPFSVGALAKDILAMANHRDGGSIVIGVVDSTFERTGVQDSHKATYRVDEMRDKMLKFADPPVRFDVDHVTDDDGKAYVVITVATFDRVPVIARAGNNVDVKQGLIYYRNSDKRVESAAISNADDMLELVMTATQRTRGWLRDRGFEPVTDAFAELLDAELDGL